MFDRCSADDDNSLLTFFSKRADQSSRMCRMNFTCPQPSECKVRTLQFPFLSSRHSPQDFLQRTLARWLLNHRSLRCVSERQWPPGITCFSIQSCIYGEGVPCVRMRKQRAEIQSRSRFKPVWENIREICFIKGRDSKCFKVRFDGA